MTLQKKGGYSGGKSASKVPPPPKTPRPAKARVYKNEEFFKVGNSRNVTVTITMNLDNAVGDEVAMLNAAEALKYFYDHQHHKSWVTKITVDN